MTSEGYEVYVCPVADCLEQSRSKTELTKHLRTHNSNIDGAYKCDLCDKCLSSQSSLDRHQLVHSGEDEQEEQV